MAATPSASSRHGPASHCPKTLRRVKHGRIAKREPRPDRFTTPNSSRKRGCTTDAADGYDWSQLNTPPEDVTPRRQKTAFQINSRCTPRLRKLGDQETGTQSDGLRLLVQGVRKLITEKWKVLLVYIDEHSERPGAQRPWSHALWSKWGVVEAMTRLLVSYNDAAEEAADQGVYLCTREVDRELLHFLDHLLDLGQAESEDGVIVIKEWEYPGTLSLMRSRSMTTREVRD